METKRQQKVAGQIQQDLSEIFQREMAHTFGGAFITITTVRITPDLGLVRVYLSFLGVKNTQFLLEDIREKTNMIRQALGRRVRNQLRVVPNLNFFLDDTAEYAERIEKLFVGLVIPPAEEVSE